MGLDCLLLKITRLSPPSLVQGRDLCRKSHRKRRQSPLSVGQGSSSSVSTLGQASRNGMFR
ncbi:hypothetical protein GGD65_002745 [Bradyrhizobium sp. CIR18]|nr:hypothetical protein [Bradyrhizobium sp. CIR18]